MIGYRICERKGEKLLTLFHSLNGSREMPIGIWLNAKITPVRDASANKGKEYMSGFHCVLDLQEIIDYKKMFKKQRDLVIVKCEIEGNRKKLHSKHNIILADKIKLLQIVG